MCAALLGSVGHRPEAAHAANATIGAGSGPNRFTPNTQTVNVGDTVTFVWISSGASGHDVTATGGAFPKLVLTQAAPNAEWKPTTPGTYYFYCSIHAPAANATEEHVVANDAMVGKIVVVASGAAAPVAVPAKTGSAGLAGGVDSTGVAMTLGALALLAVASARFATRRDR